MCMYVCMYTHTHTHTVLCLVAKLCLTLCDPLDCSLLGSSVHGDSPGNNTGVGCHAVLQGIFPTQGSNPGLPHYRQIPYYLSHQGSPWYRVHKDKSSTLSGSISDGHHYHRMPGVRTRSAHQLCSNTIRKPGD